MCVEVPLLSPQVSSNTGILPGTATADNDIANLLFYLCLELGVIVVMVSWPVFKRFVRKETGQRGNKQKTNVTERHMGTRSFSDEELQSPRRGI